MLSYLLIAVFSFALWEMFTLFTMFSQGLGFILSYFVG